MESVLHFVVSGSVLLLNGSFVQSAAAVRYDSREPLFVTVLPLEAQYLPYTVEFVGGNAVTNTSLAVCRDMGEGHKYIELLPRSAYVYSASESRRAPASQSLPSQLLEFLRAGNIAAARSLLTPSLGESVSDEGLVAFFEGVEAIRENVFTAGGGYLLIKSDGTAPRCDITVKHGLIENIVL